LLAADSFGMLMWELLHSELPFESQLCAPGLSRAMQKMQMIELARQVTSPPALVPLPIFHQNRR
jgi:hypothetical protein